MSIKEQNAYSTAANVAEEVFSGIRTVFAFGGEGVEVVRCFTDRFVAQLIVFELLVLGPIQRPLDECKTASSSEKLAAGHS